MRLRDRQQPLLHGRWGIIALALLTICGGALLLLPKLDLQDVVRDGINQQIQYTFGEDWQLDRDVEVSIRPDLRVVVTEPTFARSDGSGAAGFLTASRIETALRIVPLLLGRMEIARVHLYRPHISIDSIDALVSLWSGMSSASKTGSNRLQPSANIVITEGALEFGGKTGISDLNLAIRPRTASGGMSARGDFITGSRQIFVDLQVDDPLGFFSDGGSAGTASVRLDAGDPTVGTDASGTAIENDVFADLRSILDYVNVFASGTLSIDGHFAVTQDAIRLSNATFSKSGIALQGNLDLRSTGATSIFPQLQILQVSADTAISDATRKMSSGNWPAVRITTRLLNGLEIDVELEGQDIAIGGAEVDAVTLSLHTHNDNLSLDVAAQSETLGRLEASTAINHAAEMMVSARLFDASVREIMQPISRRMQTRLFGRLQLPEGALDADVKLAGRGQTAGEILESLAGSATVSIEDGSLTGADVTATLETLAKGRQFMTKETGPLVPAAGRTSFDLLDGQIGIEAGTARISRLNIAGERLEIDVLGEVGLKNGALYVTGNAELSVPQEKETEKVARYVNLPFGIGGTVFSPTVAAGVPQFASQRSAPPCHAPDQVTPFEDRSGVEMLNGRCSVPEEGL